MSSNNTIGTPIARGPMGGNQYTQVHNLVFRDPRLSAKAKGVFGDLSTHCEGWEVTVESITKNHRDGRDAIKTALRELEQLHYIVRHQERASDGTWGEPVLFITDLPAQIRALGVTDDDLIASKVNQAFQQWLMTRSAPGAENPLPGLTSDNADGPPPLASEVVDNSTGQARFPRSQPETDLPLADKPLTANPTPKKNNPKKTNSPEHQPGGPAPLDPPAGEEPNGSSPPDTAGLSASGVTNQGVLCKDHQTARAKAGPAALAAYEADPNIDRDGLAAVITADNDRLSHMQAVGRATRLLAYEHKARLSGDRQRQQTPA